METAYYSTLVKVALTKDSESADPTQNLDQVIWSIKSGNGTQIYKTLYNACLNSLHHINHQSSRKSITLVI
jgi:hypothetical protein